MLIRGYTLFKDIMKLIENIRNLSDVVFEKAFQYRNVVKWIIAFFVALTVILFYNLEIFERLELLTIDYRFVLRHAGNADQRIVFIDMAEDSIEAIGRWPWPRKWHAALVKALSEYKPKAIAFDVIFSEPQDDIDDSAFEEAIKQAGVVYLPLSYNLSIQNSAGMYKGEGVSNVFEPIPQLARYIKGTGHINAISDIDGILRRACPVISYNGTATYQLGFKIGCDMLELEADDISFDPKAHKIILKKPDGETRVVPLDKHNQMIINWTNLWGKELRHFSFIDVIKSYAQIKEGGTPLIDLNVFKDKICIIGLTALGLTDIKPIPIERAYPAVGANAMVLNSIITGNFIHITNTPVDIIIIFIISVFFTVYLFGLRPIGGIVVAFVSMAGYFLVSLLVFSVFSLLIITFYPIMAILISYGFTAIYTQVIQSVERARLFKQATRDGLTTLYNVRHFNLLIEAELRSAGLDKSKHFSIIMFDIDNFKKLNDTHGHQAGDTILRDFAKAMQSKCRQTDVVARYGGEEFIIMLIGAKEKEAADVAEKIRQTLESKKFKFGEVIYSTSVSIGVVEYSGEKTREEIVEKADKALYHSKHTGKNRVTVYTPEIANESITPPPAGQH